MGATDASALLCDSRDRLLAGIAQRTGALRRWAPSAVYCGRRHLGVSAITETADGKLVLSPDHRGVLRAEGPHGCAPASRDTRASACWRNRRTRGSAGTGSGSCATTRGRTRCWSCRRRRQCARSRPRRPAPEAVDRFQRRPGAPGTRARSRRPPSSWATRGHAGGGRRPARQEHRACCSTTMATCGSAPPRPCSGASRTAARSAWPTPTSRAIPHRQHAGRPRGNLWLGSRTESLFRVERLHPRWACARACRTAHLGRGARRDGPHPAEQQFRRGRIGAAGIEPDRRPRPAQSVATTSSCSRPPQAL